MKSGRLKFISVYGYRNLRRHPRRTLLTIGTVAFTFAISMVASRYATAVMDLWKTSAIETGTSHVQIHKMGFWEKQEGVDPAFNISDADAFIDKITHGQGVESVSKRFRFEGIISNDVSSTHFLATAVDGKDEVSVSPQLFNTAHDVGVFVNKDVESGVTVGKGLASLLKLNIGDEATLVAQTGQGSVNAVDVKVVGIVDVPLPSFSKHVLYLNLGHAQKLLRMPGVYNEAALRLSAKLDPKKFVNKNKDLAKSFGFDLHGWWAVEPLISKIELIWRAIAGLLCFLLSLSAAMTVINIIFIMVNERTVEIGSLMALGAKTRLIRLIFAAEGAMIGLFGALFGSFLALLALSIMGLVGIPFESPFGGGFVVVYPSVDIWWTLAAFFVSVTVCSLCSIPPANRAARVDPVVAFRNVV